MYIKNNINSYSICKCIFSIAYLYIALKITNKKRLISTFNKRINKYNINYTSSFQFDNNKISFNLSSINYYFSYFYNQFELEYCFFFFDQDNNLIYPSDLALYYNFHTFCISKSRNFQIQSLSKIHQNKFFCCLEYYELNIPIKFEVKICNDSIKCTSFKIFDYKDFNYNHLKILNNEKFNCSNIKKQHFFFAQKVYNSYKIHLLEKSYISYPICSVNEKAISFKNIWYFKNINNHYFCICKGNICPLNQNFDDCKYYFYLSIINDNKCLYEKSYYLLVDFLYANRAPGDSFFLFKEMNKQNMPAFYLTERKDIYQEYYDEKSKFQKIIPIVNKQYNITGNILEKYLSLFLKLKVVISGSEFYSKENIFFNINYITFICLGHGVNYFKPFLYKDYYGCKRYDKIILPSEKVISIAKKYGWKNKNILKFGLPKWDLFYNYSLTKEYRSREKCIFMMFTWRKLRKGMKISPDYFNNIYEILNNSKLKKILHKKKVTLYISLHHNLLIKQNLFINQTNAKYVNQEDILTCLMKCNLIVSDFSSVIFDLMYRNKPFIIFIPDSEDENITQLYDDDYINIINSLKNDSIKFENKFFNSKSAIKKIIYYIENNFQLDLKLKILYKKFNLKYTNSINHFINYLKNL